MNLHEMRTKSSAFLWWLLGSKRRKMKWRNRRWSVTGNSGRILSIWGKVGLVCTCVCLQLTCLSVWGKKRGEIHFCIMVRASIFFISLCFFFFHTKCSGLRNLFYFILFKFKLNEATSPFWGSKELGERDGNQISRGSSLGKKEAREEFSPVVVRKKNYIYVVLSCLVLPWYKTMLLFQLFQ